MALLPVSETSKSINPEPNPNLMENKPRQPTSLQGLLRFSMDVTRAEDAPLETLGPMDEERKKFLEGALSSMTVDVVEILQTQIKTLRDVDRLTEAEVANYINALDTILDYVDNIDTANDFHKIGGFLILYPCLKSRFSKIRAITCELIGVLCQNNPYCQKVILENEFVPFLLNIIETDDDVQVIVKALFALGGIIRENTEGVSQFFQYRGLSILFNSLSKFNNESVTIKICFLLSSLSRLFPDIKEQLVKLGFIHQLLTLFMMERCPSHEYVLSFLVTIMDNYPPAVKECIKFRYNVKDIVQRYMNSLRNSEYFEEEELCRRILHMINAER
ncbi:unnamed protein product [Psylliodes chrysocephalus]|uniref:Nucleotide exchange factor Fes1 domain-containing protein n=1 Tax=Psylliodes chrysocephalus TaxID=3402493 RepID=A0A9P0G7A6_9CUCU|nr:unnamed protein product [Psylliodes chrysocephala]